MPGNRPGANEQSIAVARLVLRFRLENSAALACFRPVGQRNLRLPTAIPSRLPDDLAAWMSNGICPRNGLLYLLPVGRQHSKLYRATQGWQKALVLWATKY